MRRFLVAFTALAALLVGDANAAKIVNENTTASFRQRHFTRLVSYRFEAIETAFGPLNGAFGTSVDVTFKRDGFRDGQVVRAAIYQRDNNALVFPTRLLNQAMPSAGLWLMQYWPFYENEALRSEFPVVEMIDTALWDAFLQGAAAAGGQSWPASECFSPDVTKKLPCRMVVRGAFEYVHQLRTPIFNENRLDRILPENFTEFCRRDLSADSREYQEVERFGGILLLKPLIAQFGVPRTLAYAARTPFTIEDNNVRMSVSRYQERARAALAW